MGSKVDSMRRDWTGRKVEGGWGDGEGDGGSRRHNGGAVTDPGHGAGVRERDNNDVGTCSRPFHSADSCVHVPRPYPTAAKTGPAIARASDLILTPTGVEQAMRPNLSQQRRLRRGWKRDGGEKERGRGGGDEGGEEGREDKGEVRRGERQRGGGEGNGGNTGRQGRGGGRRER